MQVRPIMFGSAVAFKGAEPAKKIPVTEGVRQLAPAQPHDFVLEFIPSQRPHNSDTSRAGRQQHFARQREAFETRVADFQRRLEDWLRRENLSNHVSINSQAWINETVYIRSSRQVLEKLAKAPEFQDDLQLIDVPATIVFEHNLLEDDNA